MPTNPDIINLLYIVAALLIPILPSLALFSVLRSTAIVSGKVAGLTIRLGGSFAAYFLLFYFVFSARPGGRPEMWQVTGAIAPASPGTNYAKLHCTIFPDPIPILPNKTFTGEIPVHINNGKRIFPSIVVMAEPYDQFETETIPLDEDLRRAAKNPYEITPLDDHTISISPPVTIHTKEIPLNPKVPAPSPEPS